jgi:hypothetical protein
VNQNVPTGICCIKKFPGGYTPGPHIKGIKVGRGFKRNSKGGTKRNRREIIGNGGATDRKGRE